MNEMITTLSAAGLTWLSPQVNMPTTSGAELLQVRQATIFIGQFGLTKESGTASEDWVGSWTDATSSGTTEEVEDAPQPPDSAAEVNELRRISGLTWEQLGGLLGVSRRAVHFWASGKTMNDENRAHLRRVLDIVRRCERGSAAETRARLLDVDAEDVSALDFLASGRFDEALQVMGEPGTRPANRIRKQPPPVDVLVEGPPLPAPEDMVDARHDPIHPSTGRRLASKPIGRRRGK